MKLQDIYKDAKLMIAIGTTIVSVAGIITVYAMLPKRVAAVGQTVTDTKDKVQNLAATVDKYVALNEEQKKDQDTREKLMLELIKSSKVQNTEALK
jgi:hypothetical protein